MSSPPVPSLGIQIATRGGATVATISGEIDMHTSPRLRAALLDLASRTAGPLCVDLANCTHMDSSGVGTMVFLKREVERRGRKLFLVGLQPRVRGVFEITNLDKFFLIVRSVDEALAP